MSAYVTPTLLSCSRHINHLTASFLYYLQFFPFSLARSPTWINLLSPTIELLILEEAEKVK